MDPSQIASTVKVRDVKISPDGHHILYQVQAFYKPVDRFVAELWLAEANVAQSARQLTDGQFYDKLGVFHPTKPNTVIFLSDRWSPGKAANLYSICADDNSAEPALLMREPLEKGVQQFQISPDGRYLAFAASREPDAGVPPPTCDAKRVSDKFGLSGLFVLDLTTLEVSPISTIRGDRQVEAFVWSPDSTHLLYRLRNRRSSEAAEEEVLLEKVSIRDLASSPISLGSFARAPAGPNLWLGTGHIASLQNYEEESILDARAFYLHRESEGVYQSKSWMRRLYGLSDDAVRLIDMGYGGGDTKVSMVAVEVSYDTETRIDAVILSSADKNDEDSVLEVVPLFQTHDDAIWFHAWDARRVSTDEGTYYVFAAVLSSVFKHEAPNVWSKIIPAHKNGKAIDLNGNSGRKMCLSDHLQWLVDAPKIEAERLVWKGKDGEDLTGMIRYPAGYSSAKPGPLPTVLFLHGGPYRRDIPDYMPYCCNWRELLASHGYVVISPNYRGSQGRGHVFASAANMGVGALDWEDCESMVDEVIKRGIADPNRLGIAGWSHGGSLTAWGITHTKTKFRAAIVGAGVSNWESMIMEASSPELEAAIAGARPWVTRKDSPVHKVKGVKTSVLILHGEKDERVPLGQGLGLYRGLKLTGGTVEMLVYPREPHGFVERKHAEDVLGRVIDHFGKWLSL